MSSLSSLQSLSARSPHTSRVISTRSQSRLSRHRDGVTKLPPTPSAGLTQQVSQSQALERPSESLQSQVWRPDLFGFCNSCKSLQIEKIFLSLNGGLKISSLLLLTSKRRQLIGKMGKSEKVYCACQYTAVVKLWNIWSEERGQRSGHKSQPENRAQSAGVMTVYLKSATNSYIIHNPAEQLLIELIEL